MIVFCPTCREHQHNYHGQCEVDSVLSLLHWGEGGRERERLRSSNLYFFKNPCSFSYSLSLPPPLLVFFAVVICFVLFCVMISLHSERKIERICFLLAIMYNARLFLHARACSMIRGYLFSKLFCKRYTASHFQGMLTLPMSQASKSAGNTDCHRGVAILERTYKLSNKTLNYSSVYFEDSEDYLLYRFNKTSLTGAFGILPFPPPSRGFPGIAEKMAKAKEEDWDGRK